MHAYQAREQNPKMVNNNHSYLPAHRGAAFQSSFPTPVVQARIQEMANSSPHVKQLQSYQKMADDGTAVIQKKENKTGLPDNLKAGIEGLSGIDISDVKVHYNSSKPAQLQAHAYAQGKEIHIAPGQEKHLPHEAWHVVQQKQGRVQPTTQAKGVGINNNISLEKEADSMVQKAFHMGSVQGKTLAKASSAPGGTAQLYTTIDLNESQRWQDVRHTFPSFKPGVESAVEEGVEKYVMRYVSGSPDSSLLNVSDQGRMAMSADGGSQHTAFFLTEGLLSKSNNELAEANGDFRLMPTGNAIVVNNHPGEGDRVALTQVEAVHRDGMEGARVLETQCDHYYKNITKQHEKFEELITTTPGEGMEGVITEERRELLDGQLNRMELTAGDAFEIKALGARNDGFGWNEHYAGIVAVDGPDQVTLENYNRDSEFGEAVREVMIGEFGATLEQMDQRIRTLRAELASKWCFERAAKTDLNRMINDMREMRTQWVTLMQNSRKEAIATHHFKMYGPAIKEQSFLDKWRKDMEKKQSKLSVAKAKRV